MDPSDAAPPANPTPNASRATPAVNRYGRQAMQHWATHLSEQFARIPDPEQFFTTMGQEMAEEIAELSTRLATLEPPEPTYLAEVGRLNRLRSQAEEQVLHERIYQTVAATRDEPDAATS